MRSLREGLIQQVKSIKTTITLPIFATNQLITLYGKHELVDSAQKLFDEMPERNVFSWNAIISAHVRSRNIAQAGLIFHSASVKDLVTYNSMLSGYVSMDANENHAVELFLTMRGIGDEIGIDEFTVTTMVKLCVKLGNLCYGRQLHAYMVKTGDDRSGFVESGLIDMYSKCGCFKEACCVYHGRKEGFNLVVKNAMVAACLREGEKEMALRLFMRDSEMNDTVSYNTLISGFVQNGYLKEALKWFTSMRKNGVEWDERSFACVLSACSGLRGLKHGREIHALVIKNQMITNNFVYSGIVDVYCKCGNMKYAEFVLLNNRNGSSPFLIASVIMEYSLQGSMTDARRVFDLFHEKDAVVWTALFSSFIKLQQGEAVFQLFSEFMAKEASVPDSLILISVLGACSLQASLRPGKEIHSFILRMGIKMDEKMSSSLLDMYSKCGNITNAERIFQSVCKKDMVLYNVMIAGYAHNGYEIKAMELFNIMLDKGVEPDAVTFIAVLSACRHRGWVELGEKFFDFMTNCHNLTPENDHYACMIDLYGRAKQLEKAEKFKHKIPVKRQDAVVLGAFLNACRLNRNAMLAREVEEKLLKVEADNGSRYVQLANAYAAEGNWDEMGRIRNQMRGVEAKKFAGCSWVYMDNRVHTFTSGDKSHPEAESLISILALLTGELYAVTKDLMVKMTA